MSKKVTDKAVTASTPHLAPLPDEKSTQPHLDDLCPEDVSRAAQALLSEVRTSSLLQSSATDKVMALDAVRCDGYQQPLTTNFGAKVANNQNALRLGARGPLLIEDFHFHEKLAHFDRERIPERVVHARGSGAHGYFQVYKSLEKYTQASFLQNSSLKTPVFVRFSTVQGFRGSPDTARDIRGWATKFYTQEGNFDLVGNNTAVFFIQDAIKFPDFVHAVKPEPHHEMPQAQSAHDSFWDFVSLQPETLHNVMWAMSDRGIPKSYRTMEGFGIHTFRLVNAQGESHFVRFHWKPVSGASSLLWDEAQLINGRDPDFHRKDLWKSIEMGDYPEYELGLQIIPEGDEHKFDFDILDATKLIPESLVPVQLVGKMVLNRNPDNFFAETEQVAFCPANIVPGIDFSDDPLLQGRVFSYFDTQLHRLGGPNFHEIPINKPLCPFHNQQRDGMHRTRVDSTVANYEPNSISNNWPRETAKAPVGGGFATYSTALEGKKVRERSASFADYFSQPRLFWSSQSRSEKNHIIGAFSFELAKVRRPYIRERVLDLLARIDHDLAKSVAKNLGITLTPEQLAYELPKAVNGIVSEITLSLHAQNKQSVKSRQVALLVADGVSYQSVITIQESLKKAGVHTQILASHMGTIQTAEKEELLIDGTIEGNPSVLFDAVIVPEGKESIEGLAQDSHARYFLCQAYKHLKVIGLLGEVQPLLEKAGLSVQAEEGVIMEEDALKLIAPFIENLEHHRIWSREKKAAMMSA